MTIENYISIVAGGLLVVIGPIWFRNRRKIFDFFADFNQVFLGHAGEQATKGSSPFWMGVIGVAMVLMGAVILCIGLFARE